MGLFTNKTRIVAVSWAIGCALTDPTPSVSLPTATLEVLTALDEAVERAEQGDRHAVDAWVRSHELFEANLEPRLRRHHSGIEVAHTEYAFGRIRILLDRGDDPRAEVEALANRLRQQVGALQ